MFTFGIRIILLLILLGGAIALAGDYIGRQIGRKRLTVFNLRPRHTAFAITILTGILIVFTTLGIILILSQDARTALFGLEKLKNTLTEKSSQLEEIKANLERAKLEVTALEKTKEKLGKEVRASRQGNVLFKVDEILLASVIQAGPEREKLEAGLKQILSAADAHVRSFGVESAKHLIFIPPDNFELALSGLEKHRGENMVRVVVTQNTLFGEEVPVRLEISENQLIYKAGVVIAESVISSSLSIPEIEQEIKRLLSITHLSANNAGIFPDPSGSMGRIPYSEIFSLAKKIKTFQKGVRLKALAKTDLYSIGPLEIDFKVYRQ